MDNNTRKGIDPIWYAPILVLLVAGLIVMTGVLFSGTLRKFVPLELVADRSGLVMEPRAKVKLHGVQIGEVSSVGTDSRTATLALKMYPGPFEYLPGNIEAEIKSSTAFGAKYVDLVLPEGGPSPEPLRPGSVLRSRNVTVEVNTVFQNLQSVVQTIDPSKLNAILSAVSESLRGRGDRIGQAITEADNVLSAVNPRTDTMQRDWQLLGKTAQAYSDAAQNILSVLDSAATTARTVTDNEQALDTLLLAAVGFGEAGVNVVGYNQPMLVRAMNVLEPTTNLLMKYQPSFTCLFTGAQWFLDNGGTAAFGGNGKSLIIDTALLFGDDAYRFPNHLPKVNATGGPGGRPSCGSLPDPSRNFPVKALVTDTGWGTTPEDIRTHPVVGHPWWVNFFPATRVHPEPPSYRGLPR